MGSAIIWDDESRVTEKKREGKSGKPWSAGTGCVPMIPRKDGSQGSARSWG